MSVTINRVIYHPKRCLLPPFDIILTAEENRINKGNCAEGLWGLEYLNLKKAIDHIDQFW